MSKKFKLSLIISIFSLHISIPSFAMLESEQEETKTSILPKKNNESIKCSLNFDKDRQRFYQGNHISILRSHIDASVPDSNDKYKIVFNTTLEKNDKQNLLKGGSWINDVLHDGDLLEENHGVPYNKIDRRTSPPKYKEFPWHTHGKLVSIFEGGGLHYISFGSGTLIGKRTVLTAAHNLFDFDTKLAAKLTYFFPGRNGSDYLCKVASVKTIIHPEYFQNEKSDIGAVILDGAFEKEREDYKVSFLKVDVFNKEFIGKKARITGYPGGAIRDGKIEFLDGNHMLTMEGEIKDIQEDIGKIFYNIDTSAGQSGSAIVTEDHFCCGVHIRGGKETTGNIGTFLNKAHIEHVKDWLNLDNFD